jgi:hypothetical protein
MPGSRESKWGWLKRIFGLEPKWVRLVSARIGADENYRFFVSLTRHHSQVQSFEFVRLLLHYYARVLFLFDPSKEPMVKSARGLIEIMHAIFGRRVDADCDVLQRAGIEKEVTLVTSEPPEKRREIFTTLYYVLKGDLYLKAEIPKDATLQYMVYSVPALLQSILPGLDVRSINVLNHAVGKMNEAYHAGESFSDLRNMSAVPTEAFNAAAKLFGQPPSQRQT